ncbi:MAG: alanyl-tRNA editing protein [Candidatus Aenigmatarchaeota archaeon]
MPTKKLFWEDAYLKEFDAKVLEIQDNKIILDQTCFYANSGGQIADTGKINGIKVLDSVYDENENIVHVLENEPDFQVGDIVHGKIDWERRYNIMKLHTSAHIISAVLVKNFGKVLFTGSQIYPDRARMDFNIEKLDEQTARFIEEKANEIVKMNLPIFTRIITKEELESNPNLLRLADVSHYEKFKVLRVVEIKDLDAQLDGGTHVKSTGEIGRIKIIKRENKGKNNRRITIIVEENVL